MRVLSMLRPSAVVSCGLLLVSIPGCSCAQSSHTAAAQAQARKIAALKEFRDSGVLSDEEYNQRLAALQGSAHSSDDTQKLSALRELRDSGVLSEEEYRQKVAALTGSGPVSSASGSGRAHAVPAGMSKGSMTPTVAHNLLDQEWGLPWGTVRLPAGWGFNGGVVHAGVKGCVATGDSPMWTAESPDKNYGVSILPMLKTNWSNDPQMARSMQQAGCPFVQANSAQEYLTRYILPHLHPQFQVVDSGPEPMLAQPLLQMQQQVAQQNQISGSGPYIRSSAHADTARVLVSYQDGAHTVHEVASAMVSCTDTRMQMGMMNGGRPTDSIECLGLVGFIFHAPDDGTPFTMAALNSMKPDKEAAFFTLQQNPAWQQRFNQEAQRTQQQIAAEGQASLAASRQTNDNSMSEFSKRQAIMKGANDYRSNMINKNYQDHQAAMDKVQGGQLSYLSGTNTYTNPTTGQQVQLSNQYTNTYVNENGNVALQTNSASDPGVNWTLMTPKY